MQERVAEERDAVHGDGDQAADGELLVHRHGEPVTVGSQLRAPVTTATTAPKAATPARPKPRTATVTTPQPAPSPATTTSDDHGGSGRGRGRGRGGSGRGSDD
jgi:cell division septation protein DedD